MKDRELTPNERRLVEAITEAAELNQSFTRRELATLAGYGDSETGRVQVSRALARPAVKSAIIASAGAILTAGAPSAAAMIRSMSRAKDSSASHMARVDLLKLTGMGASEAPQGAGVVINLVLPAMIATPLTQGPVISGQAIDVEGDDERDHRRDEAGGGTRRRATPPPQGQGQAREEGGRGQKRRAKAVARPPRTISSSKRVVSEGETDG